MKTKSALSYFGSDSEVAERIASLLDPCKHVTIPFCGGMSILPHLKARAVVANDTNGNVIVFYHVMSGRYGEECRRETIDLCQRTLSHPVEMVVATEMLSDPQARVSLKAWAYWASCWIGRKGKGGTKNMGGLPSVRRKADGGTNASRIQAAANDLEAWAEQFRRCEFECLDFDQILQKAADRDDCGIYCDPPWFGAGDAYEQSFAPSDHVRLEATLGSFLQSRVVVRYGDCPQVRRLYNGAPWTITEATARTQANKQLGEVWITNFEVNN